MKNTISIHHHRWCIITIHQEESWHLGWKTSCGRKIFSTTDRHLVDDANSSSVTAAAPLLYKAQLTLPPTVWATHLLIFSTFVCLLNIHQSHLHIRVGFVVLPRKLEKSSSSEIMIWNWRKPFERNSAAILIETNINRKFLSANVGITKKDTQTCQQRIQFNQCVWVCEKNSLFF